MSRTNAFAAIVLMTLAATVHAQIARKEVILETGKGGIELTVSVPDFPISGPMDASGNPGVAKIDINADGVNVKGQEAVFSSNMANGILQYRVSVIKTNSKIDTIQQDVGVRKLLKKLGQKFEDAKPIETKFPILSNGQNFTYMICSQPVFEQPENYVACTVVESSTTNDKKQNILMLATVTDKTKGDVSKLESQAQNAFKYMMIESKARLLP